MKHKGRFGPYGGFYVPEVLIPALEEIEAAFERCTSDPRFVAELDELYTHYAGRPTPLYFARRFSEHVGFKVYVKREDLLHGGAHKVNNTLGQGLLAKYMGKTRLIAETGAGQHGLATAMIGALFGMETKIFMGVTDVARQNVNVHKTAVRCEWCRLPAARHRKMRSAMHRHVTAHVGTFYLFGGRGRTRIHYCQTFPAPIGREARRQLDTLGRRPSRVCLCRRRLQRNRYLFRLVDDANVRLVGRGRQGLIPTSTVPRLSGEPSASCTGRNVCPAG